MLPEALRASESPGRPAHPAGFQPLQNCWSLHCTLSSEAPGQRNEDLVHTGCGPQNLPVLQGLGKHVPDPKLHFLTCKSNYIAMSLGGSSEILRGKNLADREGRRSASSQYRFGLRALALSLCMASRSRRGRTPVLYAVARLSFQRDSPAH